MEELKAQASKFSNRHTLVGITDVERRVIGEWYLTNAKIKEIPDLALGISLETEKTQILDKTIRITPDLPKGVRKIDMESSLEKNKYVRQGIGVLAALIGQLDGFSDTISVESVNLSEDLNKNNINYQNESKCLHEIILKCQNKAGENILIHFVSGDGFDIPSSITFVKENSIRHYLLKLINSGFKNRVEATQVPLSEKMERSYKDKFELAYGHINNIPVTNAGETVESENQIKKKIEELVNLRQSLTGYGSEENESLTENSSKSK